jgi:hypothetical protein
MVLVIHQKENSGNCIKYQLAESLNLFKLDFYNDWVHGSLFSFFSYKKLKKKYRMVKKNFVSTSVMMVISHR